MRRTVIKGAALLAALAVLAWLFLLTVRQTASEPYVVSADLLREWTVTVEGPGDALGAIVSLRPAPELPMALSRQIFRRHSESMLSPAVRSVPLVLRREYDASLRGVLSPEELAARAGQAGVAQDLEPVCLAARRREGREPGRVFFLLFDSAAFARFREELGVVHAAAGAPGTAFDPAALSPLLIVAASERGFESWLPREADDADCVAPLETDG